MIDKQNKALFAKQAEVLKAAGHPLRLAIIDYLKDKPRCVCEIAEYIGAERSNVSRHLKVLVSAGLLEYQKDGLQVIYRLRTPCVLEFLGCVTNCLKERIKADNEIMNLI
jgi:ArsR family transcriptional regulator